MTRARDDGDGRRAPANFYAELPEQIVYLLYQVYHRREAALQRELAGIGLPLMTWRLILALQRLQPCTMNTLARLSTWERTTLTRHLDQMVKQGIAARTTPPEDRRVVLVSLTEAGMAWFERGRTIVTRLNREALGGLPPERLEILRDGLDAFLHSMVTDRALLDDILTFDPSLRAAG